MKIQFPQAGDKFDSDSYKSMAKEILGGDSFTAQPRFQDNPYDANYGQSFIGAYMFDDDSQGWASQMCPITYCANAYNTGDGHQFFAQVTEIAAIGREATDDGLGTVWSCEPHLVNGSGTPKALQVYVDGVLKTEGVDYTVDYPAGKITFGSSQAGSTVVYNGYYLDNRVGYMKDYTDQIKQYDAGATATNYVLPLFNFRFDHWTSSTEPDNWTTNGTVGRTAAYFKSLSYGTAYDCQLTATAGITTITQTLNLPDAIDQVIALAVCKTTYAMKLEVSMDGGLGWNSISLTPASQGVSKWHILAVQSAVNATTQPMIRFSPQTSSGQTSIATVAYLTLLQGGLM